MFLVACGSSHGTPTPPTTNPTGDPAKPAVTTAPTATPDPSKQDLVALGATVAEANGCIKCHTADGTTGVGPSFKGYFGAKLVRANGTEVTGDEARFRAALQNPEPLKGYPASMPSYEDQMTEADRVALIAYVRSLAR